MDSAALEDAPTPYALAADVGAQLLDAVVAADRAISWAHSVRVELLDQLRQWSTVTAAMRTPDGRVTWSQQASASRSLAMEVAAALRIPDTSAVHLIEEARMLQHELPVTMAGLRSGELTPRHASAIVREASTLPPEARSDFETVLVPVAGRLTAARTAERARRVRERMHPETIAVRTRQAVEDRHVRVDPTADGMAWLTALLPAATAISIESRLTGIAKQLADAPDETRTLGQLRADALAHLLIDGETTCGTGRGIVAKVLVTVPVMTLLGLDEEPASLEGYGPIDADTARGLAAHAPSFIRLLTHPETGAVLSVGRESYSVPSDLRTWLRVRDETCRAIGCGRRAADCDLDHTRDWQHDGQTTRHDNLAHLCRRHHTAKHQTGWTYRHLTGGILEWTSPMGRTYLTEPAAVMRT